MRNARWLPPGNLYEVTLKTFQSRFFFIPSKRLNELLVGVLAYAQAKFGLRLCFVVFMSTHVHLLIRADSADQIRDFFCLADSQIAKEVQRFFRPIRKWTGGIFAGRPDITIVTQEPEAQIARLRYLMSQGLKEGLVPHPSKWPGVHSAKALLTGSMKHTGVWVRRSEMYEVTRTRRRLEKRQRVRRKKRFDPKQFEDRLTLELSPLPCWDGLESSEVIRCSRELCNELLVEHADARARVPRDYQKRLTDKGQFAYQPEYSKKSERPKVHAATFEMWKHYVDMRDLWTGRYRLASARLREGIREALDEFPEHAFIPTGLYMPAPEGLPPP